MKTMPVFIQVTDFADDDVQYRINAETIVYYCNLQSPDKMTDYTFMKLNDGTSVKVTEESSDIDTQLLAAYAQRLQS